MTSTELMNVSAFKGIAPAQAFQVLDPHAESLADGIGSSYGIVGYKGKVWSLRLRGETYMFTRPDDGSPAAFLDVIILRSPSYKSKSFYPPGTYQDGQIGTRPTCAALDGVTPDADILTPPASACAVCPHNVFKVNAEGRKTRDCSDYKRLSVLILPTMTKALLGAALMEPVFLRVPAASLNDLALLGESMVAQGFHYSTYITRIGFDPTKPHPQMTFRALQPLTDREAPLVLPMREDATAIRITGENDVGKPRLAVATVSAQPMANAAAEAQEAARLAANTATEVAAKAAAAAQETARQLAAKTAADKATKAAAEEAARAAAADAAFRAAAAATTTVSTGFEDLGGAGDAPAKPVTATVNGATVETGFTNDPAPAQAAAVTANTVADTGAPEDADADLDARVAALLPK